ncbi:hypothetical protein CJ030_MR5G011896 [Morella rubra]|uniref:Uncharacterized protein n=1 Tax=Morella rubra TaxID=262757 RepID=A0A6A1VLQ2_9ROSI|nr:hypothetical protein CJ030_MR0G002168 [Morella rubra]KAB1212796.1 hypothetical protein CJ030_MR5G011896 [Morella rubra]
MASVPSSSPPPSSPPSASNSENSATSPTASHSQKPQVEEATHDGGALNVDEEKPDLTEHFEYLDSKEYAERFKKYEADYTCRLMAKYFSKKTLYGGDIFDKEMTIDDEIIKSSRWPCTRSYADPLQGLEDHRSSGSGYSDESPTSISNGKHPVKNT